MKITTVLLYAVLTIWSAMVNAAAATIPHECESHAPWGAPIWIKQAPVLTPLCRTGYVALHDDNKLVPQFVSWSLTSETAMGCLPRKDSFAPDPDLPSGQRAELADYQGKAGYDRGHFAPNADFAWDADVQRQSFYLSNMSPQASHLNQWQWASLEAATRAWALERNLIIMDGPLWDKTPNTIGEDKVAIPAAYWKVVVDVESRMALAFIMKNEPTPKGDLSPYLVSISTIERMGVLTLPLPSGISKTKVSALWPLDTAGFTRMKKQKCHPQ